MEEIFNTIIDSFIEDRVGLANNFLSVALAKNLKANLVKLHSSQLMLGAGIGNNNTVVHDKLVRGDKIYWLDRKHNDVDENDFFDLMDDFVLHLNRTCYTGIKGYEFHYTLYEKGSFYQKHIDQFQVNGTRAYSMVMYLNENWLAVDGGELCIYHKDHHQNIAPINGRSVFFKSNELAHEVLLTNVPRMSITGWLKIDAT